jgi:alanine racemase
MEQRPCWVEIRTRSLEDNYRFLTRLAPRDTELLAVVKANAYGHGATICAQAAVRGGARWLGVTCVEEALEVRAVCPEAHIFLMSATYPGQGEEVIRQRLTPVAWEQWQLDELESAARAAGLLPGTLPVHLEINTGMNRQGADEEDLPALLERFSPGSPLKLEGIATHLYAADEADGEVTSKQLRRLDHAMEIVNATGLLPEWLNVGASAALLAGKGQNIVNLANRHGLKAMIRPGLALYGVTPAFDPGFDPDHSLLEPDTLMDARQELKPVLSWKTRVVSVRSVSEGAAVGYNGTFVATEPMRLALLAVGYADGLDRMLGNHFCLLVRGQRALLAGRISMDQAMLDVTDIPGVEAGDEVVILGDQGDQSISAFDHADVTQTIPWEVFTRIGPRVRRVAVAE